MPALDPIWCPSLAGGVRDLSLDDVVYDFIGWTFVFPAGTKKQSASQFDSAGFVFMVHAHLSKAELQFRKALMVNPQDIDALNNLGVILRRKDRPVKAVEFLRHVAGLRPKDSRISNNLARAM